MLDERTKRTHLKTLRKPSIDKLGRKAVFRKVLLDCKKKKQCQSCLAVNGTVRKVAGHALKIVHDRYSSYNNSQARSKQPPATKLAFDASFEAAKKSTPELDKHLKKAMDDMNPLRVLKLFSKISSTDCEILGMNPDDARPEMLIWQYVPAPPVAIRPSVQQESASTEDDITNKLGDIIHVNSIIKGGIQKGQPLQTIMEQWDYLQIQVAMYINTEVPNLAPSGFGKPGRGFVQRLKGKQGRFRGNLSGKRVDFSGRTVISPDPNLGIDEVAVPDRVAMTLTYPEQVTAANIDKLRACVKRGSKRHPGANYIFIKATGQKKFLSVLSGFQERLDNTANNLVVGDTVERHLDDGDIVLFNRQPSLHKLSIMSHTVKVRKNRTFRLNECVCTPYNADFDGDEMNLHVPQTEEARAEASELMGVKHNLATPKDGTPIVAATQDFVTAAYLLSSKDRFYDRQTFVQICTYMFDGEGVRTGPKKRTADGKTKQFSAHSIDLPEPVILKPEALWTGKQVFNVLMKPTHNSDVHVNFDAAGRHFTPERNRPPDLDEEDCWLSIRNSEVMCGRMDKNSLGAGKKDSIFYVMMRDYGPDAAVAAMNRLAKLSARWLSNEGFSIGIDDVFPGPDLTRKKRALVDAAYKRCDDLIKTFRDGRLDRDPGCNEEQTMENRISGVLNEVRQKAGTICFDQLSSWNSPIIMAKSGAKGSNINVSQMVATVGQQIISSARVADGFQDRTLPHFPKAARQPPSKGFVQSSFFTGLSPTEFIFHAMSGREGLVDTAVKTAETGYMSRRLMKSLEDLAVQYDDTVRNSSSGIIQFLFGEDGLDPLDMEGRAKPVNFERSFLHAQTSKFSNSDKSLTAEQVKEHTQAVLQSETRRFLRKSLLGQPMDYHCTEDRGIDQYESRRLFLTSVEQFICESADELERMKSWLVLQRPDQKKGKTKAAQSEAAKRKEEQLKFANAIAKISKPTLDEFLHLCLSKYEKSRVSPYHAVGAVGAQSIGEPGTQMTLKTFHFAGVAGMSITQGVPRIKEIINGSKLISTPVISCKLENDTDEHVARIVRSRVEKTYLRDIVAYIDEVWTPDKAKLSFAIDMDLIQRQQLDIKLSDIKDAILSVRGLKLKSSGHKVRLKKGNFVTIILANENLAYGPKKRKGPSKAQRKKPPPAPSSAAATKKLPIDSFSTLQHLKRILPVIPIKGLPDVSRAVISKSKSTQNHAEPNSKPVEKNILLIEGYGLSSVLTTPGISPYSTTTNSILETQTVLGIEAARATIIRELTLVMGQQMDIDPRHMQLLADVMTFKGDVLGITRFGLAKMRESVLQLASFEKTSDHLFEAATAGEADKVEGVSECVILGKQIALGTGGVRVVRDLGVDPKELGKGRTVFEDACREVDRANMRKRAGR
ncbi:MAG: hypothetical protein M1828_000802 [Chrysothrix sp. TS-e1954]|nr:MAG: hypothetical protein M1828_000802 [Chrysothrix sp. TS-e1954]